MAEIAQDFYSSLRVSYPKPYTAGNVALIQRRRSKSDLPPLYFHQRRLRPNTLSFTSCLIIEYLSFLLLLAVTSMLYEIPYMTASDLCTGSVILEPLC